MLETFTVSAKQSLLSCLPPQKQGVSFWCKFAADCSPAQVTCRHWQRSHEERPQLSRKSRSDSGGQLIKLTPFFFLHWLSCCHSPVYSHYISGQALWDCIIKLTGSITVLLQPWPTLYSPTLKHCLHWLLLWYTTKLKCPWFLFFRYCNSDHPRSPRPIKMWEDPSSKWGIGIIFF